MFGDVFCFSDLYRPREPPPPDPPHLEKMVLDHQHMDNLRIYFGQFFRNSFEVVIFQWIQVKKSKLAQILLILALVICF